MNHCMPLQAFVSPSVQTMNPCMRLQAFVSPSIANKLLLCDYYALTQLEFIFIWLQSFNLKHFSN